MDDEREDTEEESGEQRKNKGDNLKPWQFKPGQSGNPSGRPKGAVSLKEYAKRMLYEVDEDGRMEFMKGLDKKIIWEMAEGKAEQTANVRGSLTISDVLDKLDDNGQSPEGQNVEDKPSLQNKE